MKKIIDKNVLPKAKESYTPRASSNKYTAK